MPSARSMVYVTGMDRKLREVDREVDDAIRRGMKLVVIDPRRTETARTAGEYVPIQPGTDVFFYLSFLNELVATDVAALTACLDPAA